MLTNEVEHARKEIVSDGYDMSVGELLNIYKDKELNISPEYQRLFRWSDYQKTRFIETLLLGLPIPPIFVFQNEEGKWELIDGLQRVSTILEFVGILPDRNPLELNGTTYLPSLAGMFWEPKDGKKNGIGNNLQIQIKRQRLRVEILKKESDNNAKYELFQRLNTGGSKLSEQEVRNCVIVMLNPMAAESITDCIKDKSFKAVASLSKEQIFRKFDEELVIRYYAISSLEYRNGLDVHDFLDEAARYFCNLSDDKRKEVTTRFYEVFNKLTETVGKDIFRKAPSGKATQFQLGKYEAVIAGITGNWKIVKNKKAMWLKARVEKLVADPVFEKNNGAGIRGTTRFSKLIPLGKKVFSK